MMPILSSPEGRLGRPPSLLAIQIILGVLLALTAAAIGGCKKEPQASLAEIRAAYDSGDFAGAEKQLRDFIKDDPENLDAHRLLGLTLAANGSNAEALEEYAFVIERDKKDHETRYRAALVEQLTGASESALKHLEEASAIRADATYLDALGRGYMEFGRYGDAAKAWSRATDAGNVTPEMRVAFLRMQARALAESGDTDAARGVLRDALEVAPGDETLKQDLQALANN